MAAAKPTSRDWDFSGCAAITVDDLATAMEACGGSNDPLSIVGSDGRTFSLLRVRSSIHGVEIVIGRPET